jgi:hypothetical protein
MIRIYADFNNSDEQERVRLNTVGSLEDLEKHRHALKDGLKVILYMTGEFEVHGTLVFDGGIWNGIPEWETIRYENPEDAPAQE